MDISEPNSTDFLEDVEDYLFKTFLTIVDAILASCADPGTPMVTAEGFNLVAVGQRLESNKGLLQWIVELSKGQFWEPAAQGLLETLSNLLDIERQNLEVARQGQALWEQVREICNVNFLDTVPQVAAAFAGVEIDEEMDLEEWEAEDPVVDDARLRDRGQ